MVKLALHELCVCVCVCDAVLCGQTPERIELIVAMRVATEDKYCAFNGGPDFRT